MKVHFKGRRPREVVPATGARPFTAEPGGTYEVDAKTGRSLLRQPRHWSEVRSPAKKTKASQGDAASKEA